MAEDPIEAPRRIHAAADRDTLERVYRANVRGVYAFACARLGREEGQDVTGEVFHAAAMAFIDGRSEQVTPAWLMAVARNKVIDRWRLAERRMAKAHLLPLADEPADPALVSLDLERRDRVLATLTQLSHRHRKLLVLRYMEAMSVPDIAESTGESRRAVESALARARRAFTSAYRGEEAR